jgi:hypothetical protein
LQRPIGSQRIDRALRCLVTSGCVLGHRALARWEDGPVARHNGTIAAQAMAAMKNAFVGPDRRRLVRREII